LDSASRLYGNDMECFWGEVVFVSVFSVVVLSGGEEIEGFCVVYVLGYVNYYVVYFY